MLKTITIQWLGHACFKVMAGDYSIVIDPYEADYVPGFGALQARANQMICSHNHRDHGFTEAVNIEPYSGEVPFKIDAIDSWHDDRQGELRGSNKIHILDSGSMRLAHLGDLGCMPTEEQFGLIGTPDVLMIPVGGFYTIDAVTAKAIADRTGARVVIPMHYRGDGFGFDVLDTLEAFTGLYTGAGPEICRYDSDRLVIGQDMVRQIAVLGRWNQGQG